MKYCILLIGLVLNSCQAETQTQTATETDMARDQFVEGDTFSNKDAFSGRDVFTDVKMDATEDLATTDVSEDLAISDAGEIEYGPLLAFPGAIGFGKNATGGRGGIVVEVTNLNDSGPGSLRAALKLTGKRTIVFRVSGIIEGESYLSIPKASGDVTIAGHTAPGGGILIKGAELRIQASNVIIRHVRFRMGPDTTDSNVMGIRIVAYSGNQISDVILDHVSVSWASGKSITFGENGDNGGSVTNCTVQNSIVGEGIGSGYNVLLFRNSKNISYINNFNPLSTERNIRSSVKSNSFEMLNNYIYSYKTGTYPTYENQFDIIGNNWETGDSTQAFQTIRLEASANNSPNADITATNAYIKDNLYDGNEATISSNLTPYLRDARVVDSGYETFPASEVKAWVLKETGAGRDTQQGLDAVDSYYIDQAKAGTGSRRTNISDADYPTLLVGTPYADADSDGMDDVWEEKVGLNNTNGSDGNDDRNNDGFTNLEDFLHSLTLQ